MHAQERDRSLGEAPSAFNSLAVSAPLLSHTPTPVRSLVKGGIKGRGDDDDKGGGSHSSQYIYIYIYIYLH